MSEYPVCQYNGNVEGVAWDEPAWDYGVLDLEGAYTPITPVLPHTPTALPIPTSYEGRWIDSTEFHQSKDGSRRVRPYVGSGAFRYSLRLSWAYEDVNNMQEIMTMLQRMLDNTEYVIRLFPHKSATHRFFWMIVKDHNLVQYLNGRPVGYGPLTMYFESAVAVERPKNFDPLSNKLFTDSTVHGYVASDPYKSLFADSDVVGMYTDEEKANIIGIFNDFAI